MSAKYFETFELKSTWILISKSDFYIFSSYSPMLTSIVTFLWQAKSKDCTKTSFHLSNKKHHLSADWLFSIWKSPFRRRFPSVRFGFSVSWMSRSWKRRFCSCSCVLKVSCSWRERLPPESFLPKHEMMIESMLDNLRMTWQTSKGEWLLGGWTIHLTLQNPIRSSLWYIYIYLLLHTNPPNVGKYTIHGSYGNGPSN